MPLMAWIVELLSTRLCLDRNPKIDDIRQLRLEVAVLFMPIPKHLFQDL